MSGNTSASGGFVSPGTLPSVLQDPDLTDLLQELVVGITGLAPELVRPRWVPSPLAQPAVTVDWCGIGIVDRQNEPGLPSVVHDGSLAAGAGADVVSRHQMLVVMASFYGPNAGKLADLLYDGLWVPQNRETLFHNNAGLADVGACTPSPDLVNAQWINRVDLQFSVRRQVLRVYPILNLDDAPVDITHTSS